MSVSLNNPTVTALVVRFFVSFKMTGVLTIFNAFDLKGFVFPQQNFENSYKLMEEKEFRDLIIEAAKEHFKNFVEEASKEGVEISKINETLGHGMRDFSKTFEEKRKESEEAKRLEEQRKKDLKAIDYKINNFGNDLGKE